jgi:hypothetical protein
MSWTKFHRSPTKTPRRRPGGINLFFRHFLGQYGTALAMEAQKSQTGKNFKNDFKGAGVELWRAGVPLATIRKQLKMSESTLRRILIVAIKNPTLPAEEVDFLQNLVVGCRTATDCKKKKYMFFQLLHFYHCFCTTGQYFPRSL